MKLLFLTLFVFLISDNSTFVCGKNYSGYIFNENHFVFLNIDNQEKRFTPSENDIYDTEKIIKEKLKCLNSDLSNQNKKCPIIHNNLKKYARQYVGFINIKGEKILWVNFIWKKSISDEKLRNDIVNVFDGCSYFWNVKVNIDSNNLFDLNVNG